MGLLGLNVDNELERRFREAVYQRKGMKRGNLTEALEEAIEEWVTKTTNQRT